MGKRGPAPKPTPLRVLEGGNKDPDALRLAPKAPIPPAYLPAEAKRVWKEVVEELGKIGILSLPDGPSLEAYCLNVWVLRRSARDIKTRGLVVKGYRGQKVKNVSVGLARDAADKIRAFAREFGLTPSSRAGIKIPELDDDELDAILTPKRSAPAPEPRKPARAKKRSRRAPKK